ncbi:CYCT1-4 [Linum perenne]
MSYSYDILSSIFQRFLQITLPGLPLIWLRSSLWLQFQPHQIAGGAAYLAAKFLNLDLTSYQNVWREFQTPPAVLQDVAHQLMELF